MSLQTKDADLLRLAIKEFEPESLSNLKALAMELLNNWIMEENKRILLEMELKEVKADAARLQN
jgi:hypothetical protein